MLYCFSKTKRLKLEDLVFGLGSKLCPDNCYLFFVGQTVLVFGRFLHGRYFVRIIYLYNANDIQKQNKTLFFNFKDQANKTKISCNYPQ